MTLNFLSISWLFPEFCLTIAANAGRCRQDFGITVLASYFLFSSSYSIYFVGSGRAGRAAVVCHQGDQKSFCFLQSTGALQPCPSQARFCCWWGLGFRFLPLWPLWHEEIIEGISHSAVVFAVLWFSCSNPLSTHSTVGFRFIFYLVFTRYSFASLNSCFQPYDALMHWD